MKQRITEWTEIKNKYHEVQWDRPYISTIKFCDWLEEIISLNPKWIGITSLFYDGEVNCKIETQDYTQPVGGQLYKEAFYNIYSIRLIERLFTQHGYGNILYTPFEIDIDLPKPSHKGMGTYTEMLKNGKRIQISGPIMMSWYFILASKTHSSR